MLVDHCRRGGFLEAFADHIGVHDDTMREWCKHHVEWKRAYAMAKQAHKAFLMRALTAGLTGRIRGFNAASGIFLLKACHGMREDGPEAGEDTELEFDFSSESADG